MNQGPHEHRGGHEDASASTTDPVCGMHVVPWHSKGGTCRFQGRDFFFCSEKCREKFKATPDDYVAAKNDPSPPEPTAETEYTCPMHPEVVRQGPGSCPRCGMALEPRTVSLSERNPELEDMTRRFWVAVALTSPVFALAMAELLPGQPVHHALGAKLVIWVQLALSTPVVLWGGLAALPARLGVTPKPQPQHVHAHRAGDRGRVRLQPRRNAGA